jgi:hypothetical protein
MKNQMSKIYGWLAVAGLLTISVRADNSCMEGGPHYGGWTCYQSPSISSASYISPTNMNVLVGQTITEPQLYNLIIINGVEYNSVTYDCSTWLDYVEYQNQSNSASSIYFVPPIPSTIQAPGTYTYSGKIDITSSDGLCPTTVTVGTVTVHVDYSLIDVDFGGGTNSLKTGYAAVGTSTNDFWNEVGTNNVANLKSVGGYVSLVGLELAYMVGVSNNGASDPMFDDYVYGSSTLPVGQSATVTLTNLPAGSWNIYLYASDGSFDLSAGGVDYGTQTCFDQFPGNRPVQGEQYVLYSNVTLTNGQNVTIKVQPGTSGYAMISGLQITTSQSLAPPGFPTPAGLVGWWQGESNALDSTGLNPVGILEGGDITYAPGEVGLAFSFGGNSDVHVVASSALDVGGNGGGLTIEGWINPSGTNFGEETYSLVESDAGNLDEPVVGLLTSVYSAGDLYAYFVDTNGNSHEISTDVGGLIGTNSFYHVAVTYDPASSNACLYCNGILVTSQNIGRFTPQKCRDLYWGYSDSWGIDYQGLIDELSIYNRALTAAEVASIYNSGNLGKYPIAAYIVSQPSNQTTVVGGSVTFTVGAGGSPPLAYQWYYNSTNLIANATNAILTLTNVQTTSPTNYWVVVSNALAVVTSSNATLTVGALPVITAQPTNQTVLIGGTAIFSVTSSGTMPLHYLWYFNLANLLASSTNPTFTISNVETNNIGNYFVVVTNIYGSMISSNAMLTVTSPPPCVLAPSNMVAWWQAENNALDSIGTNNGTLEGGAGYASGEVGQAFYLNGTNAYVSVPDSPPLDFSNAMTVECWLYRQSIVGSYDPVIKKAGNGGTYGYSLEFNGGNILFWVFNESSPSSWVSSSGGPITLGQWYHVAGVYDGGTLLFYVNGQPVGSPVFSSGHDIYSSSNPLRIGSDPDSSDGSRYFNGMIDEAAVYNRALSSNEIASIYNAGRGGKCPSEGLPAIVLQPTSQVVLQGNTATFDVLATGAGPLNYLWYFNTTNLLSTTNALLTLTNVQPANAGSYFVVVTNMMGSVTSSVFTLTVVASLDSDYDGRNDSQELSDGTDPFDPGNVLQVTFGHWRFDNTNTWIGDMGQLPLFATNIIGVPGLRTNAVLIDSNNPAILEYRDVETNGNANINCRNGTVRFWFKPDWSSANQGGTGPGSNGRLIEVGNYNPVNTNGWWALYLSSDGTQILFGSSTNGAAATILAANISWTSNQWHQIVLTYTPTNSILYLDLQPATNGSGVAYYPNVIERAASGFRLGSDANGSNQARGAFDELDTYNYPLNTNAINYVASPTEFSSVGRAALTKGGSLSLTLNPPIGVVGGGGTTSGGGGGASGPVLCMPIWSPWEFDIIPEIYDSFCSPEPGLVNETMTIDGGVTKMDGEVYREQLGIPPCNVSPSEVDSVLVLGNPLVLCTIESEPSQTFTSSSYSNPGYGPGQITFTPTGPGDETVQVYVSATTQNPFPFVAQPTGNPLTLAISVLPPEQLAYWSFDNDFLAGDSGQLPVIENNVTVVPSPFGQAVDIDTNINAELEYPAFQNDAYPITEADGSTVYSTGTPNVRRNEGTISFWFNPNWTNGSGPVNGGIFLDMINAGWSLQVTNKGGTIEFDSGNSVLLSSSINWTNSVFWHKIVVTYSATGTTLYVDGAQVATGSGISPAACFYSLTDFLVGSDGFSRQVHGIMDELKTYNYVLSSSQITADYDADCAIDANGDGIPDLIEFEMGIDPSNPPAQTGGGSNSPTDPGGPQVQLLEPINANGPL